MIITLADDNDVTLNLIVPTFGSVRQVGFAETLTLILAQF